MVIYILNFYFLNSTEIRAANNNFKFLSQVNLSVAIVVMVRITHARFRDFNIDAAILMTSD
jgi:hypothetical protein